MDSTLRRTWAEIDMDALAHNYETLRKRIGENVKFLGVVKADAYGHGSVQVSRLLQESGADYLAVSYFENSDAFYEAQVLAEMTVEDCENAVREMFDPEKSSISVVDNK